MGLSIDQLLDTRTLLVVGALVAVVLAAVGFLFGRETGRRSRVRAETAAPPPRRLALVESLDLDAHRRLVILRRDSVEHLVLVGVTTEVVVETGIERASGEFRAEFPLFRGPRPEPEAPQGSRASSAFVEAPDLVLEPGPLPPVRSAESAVSHGVKRAQPPLGGLPLRTPPRAVPSPGAGEARPASPQPPRLSVPPPPSTAGRVAPHRAQAAPPTRPPPTADPSRVDAPVAPSRSLATPFLRSTPPASTREPEPQPAEPDRDSAPGPAAASGIGIGGVAVPSPDEREPTVHAPRSDAAPESGPPDADAADEPPLEPHASGEAEASGGRDPIDRLEAEIARLLGRAPVDP